MHNCAVSEGLYCTNVTGYKAANSFLRMVRPLVPEMIFQLSSIKPAWTDRLKKHFMPPHLGQEDTNVAYQLYLRRDRQEEDQSLLECLRKHTLVGNRSKTLDRDKYLKAVKCVSVFNPVFFFQNLPLHHPCHAVQLRHLEESSMPPAIQYIMTVSRAAAQRINRMVTKKLFAQGLPLSNLLCMAVADDDDVPYRRMRMVITKNKARTRQP